MSGDTEELIAGLEKRIADQRERGGDMLTYGTPDPLDVALLAYLSSSNAEHFADAGKPFVMVPREPTEAMIEAAKDARHTLPEGMPHGTFFARMWCFMIAAAPKAAEGVAPYPNLFGAFRTTTSSPGSYVMTFKFPTMQTMHAADDEWHQLRKFIEGDEKWSGTAKPADMSGTDATATTDATPTETRPALAEVDARRVLAEEYARDGHGPFANEIQHGNLNRTGMGTAIRAMLRFAALTPNQPDAGGGE